MGKRILSTLIIWSIVASILIFLKVDGSVMLLAVLSAATQFEFYKLLERMGRKPFRKFGTVLGTIIILGPYFVKKWAGEPLEGIQSAIIAVTIVACCLRILKEREADDRIESLGATLLGLIYIPFMLTFLIRIVEMPRDRISGVDEALLDTNGLMLVLWLVVTAKFCDVGALLVGKAIGKHPMSPNTSPKKTWEGAIGGCLISVGLGFSLTYFAADYYPDFFSWHWGTLFALPIAVISIISDLVESMIKRKAAQKDSGKFIPGIGGAFDLTDSLILTAPTGFLLMELALIWN